MTAVVVAVDTPYHAESNRAGVFTIPGVPVGRYQASAWHERHKLEAPGDFPREVRVSAWNVAYRFRDTRQRGRDTGHGTRDTKRR